MKYAVALAGGGTKGSYQIGVWKAFREMGIEIEAIAGTSIGAINGAAIVMGDFDKVKKIWENLDYSLLFDYSKINKNHDFHEKYENIKDQVRNIVRKRGLDITPLRKLLNEIIDEEKIRNSKISLIIVTVSIKEFKPVFIDVKEIPQGQIVDYILASAALPIFQRIEIDGKTYLDGGAYDILPINILIEKGFKNIIAVDLRGGLGIRRRIKDKSIKITYIRNSHMIGGLFEFDVKLARRNVRLGYLDAKKAFGYNYGVRYFIKDCKRIKLTYAITNEERDFIFGQISKENEKGVIPSIIIKILLKNLRKYTKETLNEVNVIMAAAEIAAETFEIDRIREYSREELVKKVMKTYKAIMADKISVNNKSRIGMLKIRLSKKLIRENEMPRTILLMTLPKIYITNLFIYIVTCRMNKI